MAELTESEFSKHLNSNFQLTIDDRDFELVLDEVKAYRPLEHEQPGMERFSAFFKGPGDACLPQQMYRLLHNQMGEFEIFLVPVSGDRRGYRYEAVFNYYKESDG